MDEFEEIKEISKVYLEIAKEAKPIFIEIIKTLHEYTPELKKLLGELIDTSCEMKLRAIDNYTKAGLSMEHALLLTIDSSSAIQKQIISSFEKSKKK